MQHNARFLCAALLNLLNVVLLMKFSDLPCKHLFTAHVHVSQADAFRVGQHTRTYNSSNSSGVNTTMIDGLPGADRCGAVGRKIKRRHSQTLGHVTVSVGWFQLCFGRICTLLFSSRSEQTPELSRQVRLQQVNVPN